MVRLILPLTTRNSLSQPKPIEAQFRFAAKALYWVRQFFTDEEPKIEKSSLIDQRGIRGPQEKEAFILSQKARQIRLQEVKQQLDALKIKASKLEQKIQSDTEQFQILNSEIQKVKEAEAFMTQKHERALRKQKLEETKAAQSQCRQAIQKLDEERNHIFQIQAVQQHELAM
ncbi:MULTISPECIES: hypothetical protein [Heyndrickxia]|nr:hypothetical protein [Heyndrickxia coagulans]KYC65512.1 hypothetical protein B4100_1983 [Heyndrickxia coagulans]